MNFIPITLEGRVAWLLSVVALVGSFFGVGMLVRHGPDGFQALLAAKLMFPFAALSAQWAESFWDVPLLLMFLQLPVYAVVLTIALLRERLRIAAIAITAVHMVGVTSCLILSATEHS